MSPLLRAVETGEHAAVEQLYVALYDELHRMAQRELRRMGGGLTLGASTLLHEAYFKLARQEGIEFPDKAHFMAYASRAMRRLIIDYARRRQAQKRGGHFAMTTLPTDVAGVDHPGVDAGLLERLGAAVDRLAQVEPALAELVDLKYFVGLSFIEIAGMRGVTERTVYRHWDKARIFLHHTLIVDGDDVSQLFGQ